ncbi:MAG: RidA family protein [Deltaproteobacteria bacterium]
MKKKVHPLYYGGEKQRFARSVASGGFIFLSGSSGRTIETGEVSSNDVTEQTKVALDKIKLALAEAGSGLEHIVKMTIYLRNMSDYQAMRDAEFQYYKNHSPSLVEDPPASTVVQVVSLSKPSMLVEFDAIAILPDS